MYIRILFICFPSSDTNYNIIKINLLFKFVQRLHSIYFNYLTPCRKVLVQGKYAFENILK